jgi:F-type H+-transporting ATPase subunit epsilon
MAEAKTTGLPTKIHLTVVTPERALVNEMVDELEIPGACGYLGVLPGHAPLFTELKVGEFGYKKDGRWTWLAVAWGFAEILPDQARILAETAERAHEIDVERATRAKQRAEQRLTKGGEEIDYKRALVALERAVIRIQVSQKAGSA